MSSVFPFFSFSIFFIFWKVFLFFFLVVFFILINCLECFFFVFVFFFFSFFHFGQQVLLLWPRPTLATAHCGQTDIGHMLHFRSFFPSKSLLVELWPRVAAMDHPNLRVWASLGVILCEPQRPTSRQGFTKWPEAAQTTHRWMPSAEPPRARSLFSRPESIGDPINHNGSEFSIKFSASVSAIGFAEIPFSSNQELSDHLHIDLLPRMCHRESSTRPRSPFRCRSSCPLLLLLSAAWGTPGCSLRLFDSPVVPRSHRSFRSPVPNFVLQVAVVQVWEEYFLPNGKTPRLAEAQGMVALALSTWKKESRSVYK